MNKGKRLKELLAVKALLQSMDVLKAGGFTSLAEEERLCSSQDIGRLIGV